MWIVQTIQKLSKECRYKWIAIWILLGWSEVKVTQSCPTLCDPTDYTVHGILQVRILEWVAFPFSKGSSQTRDRTQISCIAGGFFTNRATIRSSDSCRKRSKVFNDNIIRQCESHICCQNKTKFLGYSSAQTFFVAAVYHSANKYILMKKTFNKFK